MSKNFSFSLLRMFSALALTLSIAGPASAAQCDGYGPYPGMYGGMRGACGCPYMQDRPTFRRGPACNNPRGYAQDDDALPVPGKTLGVMVSELSDARLDELGLGYGVEVKSVQPDTAAAVAGIQDDDLIVEYAGKPVTSIERLRWLVHQSEFGKVQEIKLMRDGKPMTLNATLVDPDAKPEPVDKKPNDA